MAAVTATSGADLLTTEDVVRRSKLCKQLVYRAIHTTDPASFPPPLRAHRHGARFKVRERDFLAWLDAMEETNPV